MPLRSVETQKVCPYCGKPATKLTREHIVAQSLFAQPYPANLLTVKVCEPCNQEKGKNDDYLRDFLILSVEAAGNATACTLKATTLVRAIMSEEHGNTSKVAYALATSGTPTELRTPSGLFAGDAVAVPIETERRDAVLRAMVKGLYFKEFRDIFPCDYTIDVVWIANDKVVTVWEDFVQRSARGRCLGDVFGYQCLPTEDERVTFWLLLFYESILFQVATYPPNYRKKE